MFNKSVFRLAQSKHVKSEVMQLNSVATPGPTSSAITASHKWVAAGYGGGLIVLPTDFKQFTRMDKPPLITGHAGALSDLQFDPFNPDALVTGAEDGVVKVWTVPEGGVTENISTSTTTIEVGDPIRCIRANPWASGLYATGTKSGVSFLDVSEGKALSSFGSNAEILSLGWSQDGAMVAALDKEQGLHCYDPRTGGADILKGDHAQIDSRKPHHVFWVQAKGEERQLCIFAQDKTHKPYVAFFDPRDLSKPSTTKKLDFSSGVTCPLYDPDSSLLFATLRGSQVVQCFDMTPSKKGEGAGLTPLPGITLDNSTRGVCLLPKSTVDPNKSEIDRIMSLSDRAIEPYSIKVPRKGGGFHEELYPATKASESIQTAAQWGSGEKVTPKTVGIRELIAKMNGVDLNANKQEEKEEEIVAPKGSKIVRRGGYARTVSDSRLNLDSKLKHSPFMHLIGKESNAKKDTFYDIHQSATNVPCGRNLTCNNKWFGFNWRVGSGSYLYVENQNNPGRVDAKPSAVIGHNKAITSHDFCMLDQDLLATGGFDSTAKVWKLPADGKLTGNLSEPLHTLETADKVTTIRWSPTVANCLATGSSGFKHVLQIWDTTTGRERSNLTTDHEDQIMDISFDPFSHLIATTCKDGNLRVIDPRTPFPGGYGCEVLATVATEQCVRDCRSFWVDREHIVVVGTGKGSKRSIALINWKSGKTLATHKIDVNSCALISHYDHDYHLLWCASQGGRTCHQFEIHPSEDESSCVTKLSPYSSPSGDFCGLGFHHKETANVKVPEVVKAVKLLADAVVIVSFTCLRKRLEFFQDDLLLPMAPNKPQMSTEDYFALANPQGVETKPVDRCPSGMERLSEAPEEEMTEREMRYQKQLTKEAIPEVKVGFMGNKSDADIRAGFVKMADKMPARSRFDAQIVDEKEEVDDDEWSD